MLSSLSISNFRKEETVKSNLLKGIAFFLLCVTSYYLIAHFTFSETVGKKIPGVSQVKTHQEFWAGTELYDWVVLGSSHAYRGIDPQYFEARHFKVFNLGSSSQTPINSLAILKKLPGKTKGVILEVYAVTFNLSGREAFYDLLSNGYDFDILAPMWMDVGNARTLQLLLSKPVVDYHHRQDKPREPSYKGYVETTLEAPADTKYIELDLYHKENLGKQWKAFKEILAFAKLNGIALKLVMAPLPKALKIQGEQAFVQELHEVVKPFNLSVLDFSRNHPLDDHLDFFDSDHLNARGVKWWDQKLLESF
jgi:hypothetical protein